MITYPARADHVLGRLHAYRCHRLLVSMELVQPLWRPLGQYLLKFKCCIHYLAVSYLEINLTEIFPVVCKGTHMQTHTHTSVSGELVGWTRRWHMSTILATRVKVREIYLYSQGKMPIYVTYEEGKWYESPICVKRKGMLTHLKNFIYTEKVWQIIPQLFTTATAGRFLLCTYW